jgi:hypothetical protein
MTVPFEKLWARLLAYPTSKAGSNASVSESEISAEHIDARLMEIGRRYAALPDTRRTPEEILGYDDNGLPT